MALVPTDINRLKQSAQRFASGFSRGQKMVTVVALVGVILIAVIFMSLSGKPTYSILFTNLQPSDAAAITQQLASDHVPYQLEDGGSTILVPQNDVDQERLSAAAAGLPSQSTVGLSLLDKEGLTTSQLTQQADYLQAIQGELEQTIDSISGVQSTQVSVALPANQTFALGSTNPTGASVLVDLEPGHTLTYGQVQAITSLVGSAVPGLSSSNVTVADSNGDLLAGPGVNDDGASQSNAESAYDSATAAKVTAYLTSVLGPSNADVQVNADLNFNQVKTSTQALLTNKNGNVQSACTSIDDSNEKYTGSGTPPGATASTTTSSSQSGNYTQDSTQKTCETGTTSQTIVQAPGTLIKQSIAVLVNKKAMPKGVSLTQLEKGTAAAAGIDTARGDVLSFSAAPFKSPPQTTVPPAKTSMLSTYAKPGIARLLVLLVLFLLWRSSRKARRQAREREALLDSMLIEQLTPMPLGEQVTGEIPAIAMTMRPQIGGSVQDLVDNQSEEVASVLREWLHHT